MSNNPSSSSKDTYNFSSTLILGSHVKKFEENMASPSSTSMNVASVNEALASLHDSHPTEDQFRAILDQFLKDSDGKLLDWVNATIAFAGFDALAMRKTIMQKITTKCIFFSVLVGLVRGNNTERILKTMKDPDSAKEFGLIVRALDIKLKVGGSYNAITMSRIIACFPEVVCNFLFKHELPMAVPYSELLAIHKEYPLVSRHQVCASVIPHSVGEDTLNKIFDVLLVPYLKKSEVINVKGKDWKGMTALTKAETSSMYLHNSYNSKIMKLEDREALSRKFLIIGNDKKLTTTWESVAINAKEWLKRHYSYSHS